MIAWIPLESETYGDEVRNGVQLTLCLYSLNIALLDILGKTQVLGLWSKTTTAGKT